ncbi:hypothetical protein ACOSQ3_024913 [Xanthoceras sorbifolium]
MTLVPSHRAIEEAAARCGIGNHIDAYDFQITLEPPSQNHPSPKLSSDSLLGRVLEKSLLKNIAIISKPTKTKIAQPNEKTLNRGKEKRKRTLTLFFFLFSFFFFDRIDNEESVWFIRGQLGWL